METKFSSKNYPHMNWFLERLEKALRKIKVDPPLDSPYTGFCLIKFNSRNKPLTAEEIGFISKVEMLESIAISTLDLVKKFLNFKEGKTKEPGNKTSEKYSKPVRLYKKKCVVISGRNPGIDEAIATLWLIGEEITKRYDSSRRFVSSQMFFSEIRIEAEEIKRTNLSDNNLITKIAELMESNY